LQRKQAFNLIQIPNLLPYQTINLIPFVLCP
jgi:hypothetical protein